MANIAFINGQHLHLSTSKKRWIRDNAKDKINKAYYLAFSGDKDYKKRFNALWKRVLKIVFPCKNNAFSLYPQWAQRKKRMQKKSLLTHSQR